LFAVLNNVPLVITSCSYAALIQLKCETHTHKVVRTASPLKFKLVSICMRDCRRHFVTHEFISIGRDLWVFASFILITNRLV
jgi:hypothetical protein